LSGGHRRCVIRRAHSIPVASRAVRASARGLVAAMAMTGLRVVTTRSGLLERTPPQTITEQAAPASIAELPQRQRELVTELAHWGYGAAAGAVYGSLPPRLANRIWAGPAYGIALWLFFEVALAPALKLEYARERRVAWRAMVILDHLLYGVMVSGRLAPEPSRPRVAGRRYSRRS
jgi:hypothetical protein